MASKVEFHGLAMDWNVFRPSSGRRARFGRHAFDKFVARTESNYLRLWVNHLANYQLTRSGQILWTVDADGIWCKFAIECAKHLDSAVCTAIEHGWLPGLSVHYDNNTPVIEMNDDRGPYVLIPDCGFMRELSVVDTPGCAAAFVERADGVKHDPKSFPSNARERENLVSLLRDLGIDHEPAVRINRIAAATKPQGKTLAEPVVYLSKIRAAEPSHPPANRATRRKPLTDWVADMHDEWMFKNRYQEWLKIETLCRRSPTGKVIVDYR